MSARLIVSFWDVCLDNLPEGCFERRALSAAEARSLIDAARAEDTLVCATRDDLLAPYKEQARRRHSELCQTLRDRFDITVHLKDFLSSFTDEGGDPRQTVMPLQVVCVEPSTPMLIVGCNFEMAKVPRTGAPETWFHLAEDSVRFDLIAALPLAAGRTAIP